MDNLRAIKRRIKSVTGIKQITRAMEMVSATKLKRAQDRIERARPYIQKLDDILSDILASASAEELRHPLIAPEEGGEVKRVALILITSDKGLCGSFNANLTRRAVETIKAGQREGIEYHAIPIGRRSVDFFRRRSIKILRSDLIRIDMSLPTSFINDLYKYAVRLYTHEDLEGDEEVITYDRIEIIYALFKSPMVYRIEKLTLLPLKIGAGLGEEGRYGETLEYIFEPGPIELFNDIIPQVIKMHLFSALAETIASEHGARMIAMRNATENATDMISWLTLQRNKARQAAITTELSDIVGGAEALKG
jgi:F-type H+-transporting ATPase subunit gamma